MQVQIALEQLSEEDDHYRDGDAEDGEQLVREVPDPALQHELPGDVEGDIRVLYSEFQPHNLSVNPWYIQ